MNKTIKVYNAKENNLKDISVDIPKECICGICGVSGSGKSTLACDVIAKYALNAFALSTPTKLRKKLSDGKYPHVEEVKDVPPVILIDIKSANRSVRSTVATTSGLMTILRNMFSVCGTTNKENIDGSKKKYPRLFSYNIQESEGGGACSCCGGTGRADGIQLEQIICNTEKSLFLGAFSVVNEKGVKFTKITDLFIKAFCNEYSIDTEKAIKDFTNEEMNLILYGSNKVIHFTDRSGANGGKKEMIFPGIIGALLDVYNRTKSASIEKYISNGICNICRGTRYNDCALQYTVDNFTISDFLAMSVHDSCAEICRLANTYGKDYMGFAEEFSAIANELEAIGVGYLFLNRSISTISGGELQRIKLAKQIAMKLEGYCYVLDEPSTGLHDANIIDLMKSIQRLKMNRNTVLLVEHNPLILSACDYLIELGVGGGMQGGNIIAFGKPENLINIGTTTGKMLNKTPIENIEERFNKKQEKIGLYGVSVNNLKCVDLEIPLNSFVTIAGVSGSGKSSAIHQALYDTIRTYLETGKKEYNLLLDEKIENIVRLDQNISVTNSRSNVSTLLGIMDIIRKLYSSVKQSKELGLDIKSFSNNSKNGACNVCGGTGVIEDEDGNEELCEECNGTGYKKEVLNVKYNGYSIAELMTINIEEARDIIDDKEINRILNVCCNIGLGYLALGQKSNYLSKGEYQRLRIVTEICKVNKGKTIYILDEPSKGLHFSDIKKIVKTLKSLVDAGNTVIAIEHNIHVIMDSDYVIEFGPNAGVEGGNIVFSGQPYELSKMDTYTAKAVRGYKIEYDEENENMICKSIKIMNGKYEFIIEKDKINILRGSIGSGKTVLQKNLLYANSMKRYISSISTQGKYLTRDIIAEKNYGTSLPITRLISSEKDVFGKNERVVEILNLSAVVENLFYKYGDYYEELNSSSFNVSKKAGKCTSCLGHGRVVSYDFDKVFEDSQYTKDLNELLKNRTRISRISPLLKKEFGLDISKDYIKMTEEEKQVFIFGDKKKTVYYEPKKKVYYWEGCNALVLTNMAYASESFQKFIKPTYTMKKCKYCNGSGVNNQVAEATYKGITYKDFNEITILELIIRLKNNESVLCLEEKKLLSILERMVEFGMGNIKLGDRIIELNLCERMIIQYMAYRINPLSGTMIAWDDFGVIKNAKIKEKLVEDFRRAIDEETIILIVDNNLKINDANEIVLGKLQIQNDDLCNKHTFSNIVFTENRNGAIERYEQQTAVRETLGSNTGVTNLIKSEFRKKYKKLKFTGKKEECCNKCNGLGYYEINMGDIGYSQCTCPDCNGSGFSEIINNCYINEANIGMLLKMSLEELYKWSNEAGYFEIANKLEIYVKIGLEKINILEKISNFSSKEFSLYIIADLLEKSEAEIKIAGFFDNISKEEYEAVLTKLNNIAIIKNKKIVIVKE